MLRANIALTAQSNGHFCCLLFQIDHDDDVARQALAWNPDGGSVLAVSGAQQAVLMLCVEHTKPGMQRFAFLLSPRHRVCWLANSIICCYESKLLGT